jgi:hypothetical protein
MKRNSLVALVLAIGFLSTVAVIPARAQVLEKSGEWKNFLSVYGWAQSVNGDVKIKGTESDINQNFSDFWSNAKFSFGAHYEGFTGNWGIMADGFYYSFEMEKEHPGGAIPGRRQLKFQQGLVEVDVPYRFMWKPVVADVFIGGRYNNIYGEIAIPSRPLTKNDTLAFVDPLVGARVFFPMAKGWTLGLRGDIGGFGIGNASDLALNGNVFVNWQINPVISTQLGLRALYMKYNEGENEWNATQWGPWLGVGFFF